MIPQISIVYPPMDGTVRPASLADFNLEHNPTHTAYVFSETPGSTTEISFLEFGRAAHRAAHLIRPGRSGPEREVVAIIANVDVLLYQTLVAGMLRAGVVVSFLSCAIVLEPLLMAIVSKAISNLPTQLSGGSCINAPEECLQQDHHHHLHS